MKKILVVAKSANNVIGVDNGLPWQLPEDLKHFKEITMGHPMIMGRLTYESIGRPLPGRRTIVITGNNAWRVDSGLVDCVGSISAAFERAETLAAEMGVDAAMIVGGAGVYRQTLPLCDELYITDVDLVVEGDAHFPELNDSEWLIVDRSDHVSTNRDKTHFSFLHYQRITDE